jgi:plasmid maintenance system antidote protein VapI
MSNDDIKKELARQRAEAVGENRLSTYYSTYYSLQDAEIEELKKEVDKNVIEAKKRLDKASVPLTEDMDNVAQQGQDMLELMKQSEEGLKDLLNRYDLYDDGSNKNLSALQQGIQGITEDTAGALEGYMNGVSQQVYYHSSLLEQIRDAVVGFDMDVQMGTFSQMLLQLQNSYTLMQSMQTMMENWTIPSGSGIRVQLLS